MKIHRQYIVLFYWLFISCRRAQACLSLVFTRVIEVTYVYPGLVHELGDGHPLGRVRLQQLVDQIFGWRI